MLRGIDKRDLFLRDEDYLKFIDYMKKAKAKADFTIYAYCLMTNHVHLLLKTENEELGEIVKRITVGYAQHHNVENGRTGHLFQNRFRSEVVETDKYFLTVLRYIHQNPLKARMVEDMRDYKWSSFKDYLTEDHLIIDSTFALGYFADIKDFTKFMQEANQDECLEYNPTKRWQDEELKDYISSHTDMGKLNGLDKKSRDEILKIIKTNTMASNRQLARVTGIGRGVLEKIKWE